MDEKPGFRFSLGSLIVGTAIIAIYCAAMVSGSPVVCSAIFLMTVLLLLLSILGAIESKPLDRAFWRGFALFGWSYLILLKYWPSIDVSPLTTDVLLNAANAVIGSTRADDARDPPGAADREAFRSTFMLVGHYCFTLALAFVGGLAGRFIRFRADRQP